MKPVAGGALGLLQRHSTSHRWSSIVPRNFGLKKIGLPRHKKANELEGRQDMGGKQGGQAGAPKSPPRPRTKENDGDVVPKRSRHDSSE